MTELTPGDRDFVSRIAALVVARLTATTIDSKVIDAKIIQETSAGSTIHVRNDSVVTPSAKDEAKLRNITLHRSQPSHSLSQLSTAPTHQIIDRNGDWAAPITSQLSRRGDGMVQANVILTDTPAREVAQQFGLGKTAVMITQLNDVPRFASELEPDAWVLDRKRLNLVTAVNVIASIAQRETKSK